jgi:hypothetical protein
MDRFLTVHGFTYFLKMTATILGQATPKMSAIFPTEPAKVNIHLLPKEAEFITYNVKDTLNISAWMPDNFHQIVQENEMSYDDFYHSFCDGCERNCYSFLEQYMDEDGDVNWEDSDLQGHCSVYDDGYHGQHCPENNVRDNEDIEFTTSPMVFQISMSYIGETNRFANTTDSAYLCAARIEDGQLMTTPTLMAANVFGDNYEVGNICWGNNDKPKHLREIVTEYFSTPFNNDLISLSRFQENCSNIQHVLNYGEFNVTSNDVVLSQGADALMLLDAGENVSAFFTMLASGFKSLPEAPHIMAIPIFECTLEKNGHTFNGYKTTPDAVDKSWFVSLDGLLIGQV